MSGALYQPLFLTAITILSLVQVQLHVTSQGYEMQEKGSSSLLPLLLGIVLIFWLGNRPLSGTYFGDTSNYALIYVLNSGGDVEMDWSDEWIWETLMNSCKAAGFSVSVFFTIVEAGYILSVLWAIKRLMPENTLLGCLFVLSSFSFFTYGVNGLRNGLACHIIILGISFLAEKKYVPCAVLFLAAMGIHKSTMLPIVAAVVGAFLMKTPKYAIYFWISSIFISLVAGGAVTSFFASLGFDDRMSGYTDTTNDMSEFSSSGFRWDFLLYSSMPVLMAWYVCEKKKVSDSWYDLISTIYCLCNAFWIMVIRGSFSNRFAYLSWFIYPIVIAYPLVNLAVWEDQDYKTGVILFAFCGFTVFMETIYW